MKVKCPVSTKLSKTVNAMQKAYHQGRKCHSAEGGLHFNFIQLEDDG